MNVLITGASRGIGKAAADAFLKMNYTVFSPGRDELDLSNHKSVNAFIKKHELDFDIIINNAGVNEIALLEDISDENIKQTLQINLIAPIKLLRGLIKRMKNNRFGRIVNIGSIWAVVSKCGRMTYCASKNALHGVSNTLALELAPFNILVNTVCPGFTATELTSKNNTKEQIAEIEKNIPLGRMARPEEIAAVIAFLGSEQNTYITGQKIVADGGFAVQ